MNKLNYSTGFGNEHASEALANTLPQGRNSPQKVAHGLYAEQISGTAFTVPREHNLRTWLYRIRPSVVQNKDKNKRRFRRLEQKLLRSAPFAEVITPPDQLRWNPLPLPLPQQDFINGLITWAGNGDTAQHEGIGIHLYLANQSMERRFFYNADGELLIVPQQGGLRIHTELGILDVVPGEICLIPRGIKFRVMLIDDVARGYICENYGQALRLPELGPLGANGLANPRDFLAPQAAYEEHEESCELVCKFAGHLFAIELNHSPLDVVAWHGNYTPYKYKLSDFMVVGSISFDHPDPSIFTVLTSPSARVGTANVDFVIFPPRWLVAEDTFRPPWYHRNIMSEFMGLIHGVYDAKAEGFLPGGCSLHNCMSPHGPDATTFAKATESDLQPQRIEQTMAFMLESRFIIKPTQYALESATLQDDYIDCWQDLQKHFTG